MSALAGRRLVVVTGKGGVGRTTITAALGHAAARAGLRAVVVELSGQDALARSLGFPGPAYAPRAVVPGLDLRSLTAAACVVDFAERKLRVPPVLRWVFENRLMTGFVEAVPGLHDLVQLGKLENMLREPQAGEPTWDVCVLDAPATGHGLTLLAAARAMRETTRTGPFHELAGIIADLLGRPDETAIVLVTLPEALPVHEGLELAAALDEEGTPVAAYVVNRTRPSWPADAPVTAVMGALRGHGPAEALRELARHAVAQAVRQAEALALLRGRAGHAPLVEVPELADAADPALLAEHLVPLFGGRP